MKRYPTLVAYLKNKYIYLEYFLNRKKLNESSIAVIGFQKSGNTWLRMIIANYFRIQFSADEIRTPLKYSELNNVYNHVIGTPLVKPFWSKSPLLTRTHAEYNKTFEFFKNKIYVIRNPFDTIVSLHDYELKRKVPFWKYPENLRGNLHDVDFYVNVKFEEWISHVNSTMSKCEAIFNYDIARTGQVDYIIELFEKLDYNFDNQILKKAIVLADFDKVKKFAKDTGQIGGMSHLSNAKNPYKGEFTRKGAVGEYKNILKPQTIDYWSGKYNTLLSKLDFLY